MQRPPSDWRRRGCVVVVCMYGPTVAPRNDNPKGSQQIKKKCWENVQKQILVLRAFKCPKGHGGMREQLEIVTASFMQNMVQIRNKKLFRDQITFQNF